jgi:hypothetical protein
MTSDDMGISLNWYWIYGLLLIGLASFWRRLAKDNLANWTSANKLIPRSFENTDSAVERVRVGCIGLSLYGVYSFLALISVALAIDLCLFSGNILLQRSDEIIGFTLYLVTSVGQMLLRVLRVLAFSGET